MKSIFLLHFRQIIREHDWILPLLVLLACALFGDRLAPIPGVWTFFGPGMLQLPGNGGAKSSVRPQDAVNIVGALAAPGLSGWPARWPSSGRDSNLAGGQSEDGSRCFVGEHIIWWDISRYITIYLTDLLICAILQVRGSQTDS
jgi:hypothetical protein